MSIAADRPRTARRRILRLLLAVGVLGALGLGAFALVAEPLVEGMVVSRLEEDYRVEVSVGDLDLGLGGSLQMSELRVQDLEGRPVALLERVDARLGLLRALFGAMHFDLELTAAELHVWEEADGTWSLEHLPREQGSAGKARGGGGGDTGSLDLFGQLRVVAAAAVVHSLDAEPVRLELDMSARFDGPDQAAHTSGRLDLFEHGALAFEAQLPGDPTTWAGLDALAGEGSVDLERPVDLTPLAGLLPGGLRAGLLSGGGRFTLGEGLDLQVSADLRAEGLEWQGPREGAAPTRVALVRLEASTPESGEGELSPVLRIQVDDVLSGEITGHVARVGAPDARITGRADLRGDLGDLARLSSGWIAFREGVKLGGDLIAGGDFSFTLQEGALAVADGSFAMNLEDLTARDASRGVIDLRRLAGSQAMLELNYQAETLRISSAAVQLGPLQATATTEIAGLGSDLPHLGETQLDMEADLDALTATLGKLIDLGPMAMAGHFEAHAEARAEDGRLPLTARAQASRLVLGLGGKALNIGDFTLNAGGFYDSDEGLATLEDLNLSCSELNAQGRIELAGLDTPGRRPDLSGEMVLKASRLPVWVTGLFDEVAVAGSDLVIELRGSREGEEIQLTADLSARDVVLTVIGGSDARAGSVRQHLEAQGETGAIALRASGEILALEVKNESGDPGTTASRIVEPRMAVELVAVLGEEIDVTLLSVESRAIRGELSGKIGGLGRPREESPLSLSDLEGRMTYVPDQIAGLLGPLIPGELSGTQPETCTFRLDGLVPGLDAASLVAGLTGEVELGLGRYRHSGLDVAGTARAVLADGEAQITSTLSANDGALSLEGGLKLEPGEEGLISRDSRIVLDADGVRAGSGLGPLLSFVHPAFAGLDNLSQTEIGGLITCDLDLRYEGDFETAALVGGWEDLPKKPINGSITFELQEAALVGSPLMRDLLDKLGLDGRRDFDLKPVALEVVDGRILYSKPWEWTVGGAQTTFGGSIGLDKSLDLEWSIPITDEVVARNDFLKSLRGTTVRIPLRGTVTRPEIQTDGLLMNLARDTVKSELREALDSITGAGDASGSAPGALLKRADKLWKAGDRASAAKLYRQIREEHKLSLVYALNRDRIKERGKWKGDGSRQFE